MIKYFLFISLSLLTLGCKFKTIPDVEKQENVALLDKWLYPIEKDPANFRLTQGEGKVSQTYSPASILIMNENLSPKDLVPVLKGADAFRETQAAYLNDYWHGERANYEREIADTKDAIAAMRVSQSKLEQEDLAKSREARILAASEWIYGVLEKEVSDEKARMDLLATFEHYCEGKIWELATSKLFARRKYIERPSPMQLCERYYETSERGFFNGPSCLAALDVNEGKSYMRCLWQEGVVKTRWFDEDGAFLSSFTTKDGELVDRKAYLLSLLDNPLFLKSFAREVYDLETGQGVLGSAFASLSSDKFKFIMKLGSLSCKDSPTKVDSRGSVRVERNYVALRDLCTLFGAKDKTFITPAKIIETVQWTDTKKIPGFEIPVTSPLSGDLVWQDRYGNEKTTAIADLMEYSDLIRYFGARTFLARSELDKDFHLAPLGNQQNDAFGDPLPDPSHPDKKQGGVRGAEIYRTAQVAQLYKKQSSLSSLYPDPDPRVVAKIRQMDVTIAQLNEDISQLEKTIADTMREAPKEGNKAKARATEITWSPYLPYDAKGAADFWGQGIMDSVSDKEICQAKLKAAIGKKQREGFGEPIALASVQMSVRVTREKDELKFEVWMGSRSDEHKVGHIVGCASFSTGQSVACFEDSSLKTSYEVVKAQSFTYDPSSGRMNFRFKADSVDPMSQDGKMFLAYKPMVRQWCEKDTYFQGLTKEQLAGRVIEFEVYPDVQDTYLHLLSGKVVVRSPSHEEGAIRFEHEGAVSGVYSDQKKRF